MNLRDFITEQILKARTEHLEKRGIAPDIVFIHSSWKTVFDIPSDTDLWDTKIYVAGCRLLSSGYIDELEIVTGESRTFPLYTDMPSN